MRTPLTRAPGAPPALRPHNRRAAPPPPRATPADAGPPPDAPDWDKELSIFRARVTAPNQLETLRKLEARVEVGTVLAVSDGVALVAGLDTDAPVGTVLQFEGGGRG